MTPTIYCADHQHAKVVCSAFAEGCGGKLVPATSGVRPGMAAMWGILRGAGDRIKECELYGVPYFYIDHGYFMRGHYDGYYRVVFCDRHMGPKWARSDGNRWDALGLEIEPIDLSGETNLYLPVSRHVAAYSGFDADKFDAAHVASWQEISEHPIISKPKADGDISDHLDNVFQVIGYQTNALIEAARLGKPVLELGQSPATWLSMQHREELFYWLADNQWTLEEMRSGKCWADLMARYGTGWRRPHDVQNTGAGDCPRDCPQA